MGAAAAPAAPPGAGATRLVSPPDGSSTSSSAGAAGTEPGSSAAGAPRRGRGPWSESNGVEPEEPGPGAVNATPNPATHSRSSATVIAAACAMVGPATRTYSASGRRRAPPQLAHVRALW